MAQYTEDFSEKTLNQFPSGFSVLFDSSDHGYEVISDAGAMGGKVLSNVNPGSSNNINVIKWDEIDDDPDRDNIELALKVRWGNGNGRAGPLGRGSGDPGADTHTWYFGEFGPHLSAGDTNATRRIAQHVNGSFNQLVNTTVSFTIDDWYWLRFRINGTTLQFKVWKVGDAEPGSWQDDLSNESDVSGVGFAGIYSSRDHPTDFDFIGVGTNGDSAPLEMLAQNELTINITGVGSGSVTKDPDKAAYEDNEVVTLTSIPDAGSAFKEFSGDLVSREASDDITMDADKTVGAEFVTNAVWVEPIGGAQVGATPTLRTRRTKL